MCGRSASEVPQKSLVPGDWAGQGGRTRTTLPSASAICATARAAPDPTTIQLPSTITPGAAARSNKPQGSPVWSRCSGRREGRPGADSWLVLLALRLMVGVLHAPMGAALKHLDELVCVGRGQRDIGCAVSRQDLESGGLQVGAPEREHNRTARGCSSTASAPRGGKPGGRLPAPWMR